MPRIKRTIKKSKGSSSVVPPPNDHPLARYFASNEDLQFYEARLAGRKEIPPRYFLAEIEGPEQKSDSETKKDCRCCWILTSLHSKWICWSYRSPIGALSTALESRHPGLSSNI
ncbi:uncharacterized protein DS421_4g110020 [Arachis hypogaea]|nr:uncharacterized protein DS421_4g110020 [Arachis hypogaea]